MLRLKLFKTFIPSGQNADFVIISQTLELFEPKNWGNGAVLQRQTCVCGCVGVWVCVREREKRRRVRKIINNNDNKTRKVKQLWK